MTTIFAIIALLFSALVICIQQNRAQKKALTDLSDEWEQTTIGWNELVDNYEQDFMQFEDDARRYRAAIRQLEQEITNFEVEHALLSDEIRAHRELCLPRLHEIRAERMEAALTDLEDA